MALITLTLKHGGNNERIGVNTDHIVSIQDFRDYTHIITTGHSPNGASWQFPVLESFDEVTGLYQEGIRQI